MKHKDLYNPSKSPKLLAPTPLRNYIKQRTFAHLYSSSYTASTFEEIRFIVLQALKTKISRHLTMQYHPRMRYGKFALVKYENILSLARKTGSKWYGGGLYIDTYKIGFLFRNRGRYVLRSKVHVSE